MSVPTAAAVALLTGMGGDAIQHFGKALSKILRYDLGYEWVPITLVIARVRTSHRHGPLTVDNVGDVLLGSRRFETRIENGITEIRAVRGGH